MGDLVTETKGEVQKGVVYEVKGFLKNDNVKKRFEEILGQKAPQFMASIINVVSASKSLQKCESESIMAAAFIAASFDLPIDQNLGFSAIVPYRMNQIDVAQFQMMYKGFIQLAMRSGQYRAMNYAKVYEDELKFYDPITKRVEFVYPRPVDGFREKGQEDKVVGYYAWFALLNGFTQELYMSVSEITKHAKKFSKSYQYDLRDSKKTSMWSKDFEVMAYKTVIKLILSKWGILSIDMQRALEMDQQVFDATGKGGYSDNPAISADSTAKLIKDPFSAKTIEAQTEHVLPVGPLTEEEKAAILEEERLERERDAQQ